MGEFEALDQSLLFEWGEGALRLQFHGERELAQGTLKIVEALLPANIQRHGGLPVESLPFWLEIFMGSAEVWVAR